ncbi:MAG: NADH-quinone oxidoreductase subunit A [Chitinophagaceae bacterium]|nr:NADH-quinone oxidoreductase subunit A [Chitinophagaceae bacterium]MCO5284873.1 NADH-quinone oxidoreductase subunit A [Chitinophagaceae bacterium]MCW5915077.1 NADH-quinone oxidoreductase subunit A [Chitinophagaceae bacterium]MCZ2396654.1 NADH-quinone oxidoreductase subunit A [Chitinophagales bacterium]
MQETESLSSLWPLLVYAGGVVLLVTIMLTASHFLGERHKETVTDRPYESGIKVTGDARFRFPVHFYILAMLFVIFDLEVVFVVAWAIHAKALGWAGYIAISIFIGLLVAVLIYEWRMGALDFGPSGKKILKSYHEKFRSNPEVVADSKVEN